VTAIGPVLRQAADDAADGADAKLVSAARAKREKSQAEEFARLMPLIRRYARLHATAVAAIIISGDPKIDEPLVRAWERTLAHYRLEIKDPTPNNYIKGPFPELRVAEKIYPAIVEDPDYGRPHSRWDPRIAHAPESARFTEIFRTAPVWLLQFTGIGLDASLLEFDLPDISAEAVWGTEGVKDSKRWPRLPLGTMAAGDPVRTPAEEFESDLSPEEERFYQKMKEKPEEEWSRLERRRMLELIERLSPENS
jgi:hypothetical protein